MNLPAAFPYKGFLVCIEREADHEFYGSFDFGDEAANEEYRAQFRAGEILNVSVTVRRFSDSDEPGEVVAALGGVHLLNDGTVRKQVRALINGGELMTPGGGDFTTTMAESKVTP